MDMLQRLSRRELDTLQVILACETAVRGIALGSFASALKVTPPSALGRLTRLEELDLVTRHRGKPWLTARGQNTLVEYRRHHRIAKGMFSQRGPSPEGTYKAAHEVDLAISHTTVERLSVAEGHPEIGRAHV